MWPVTVGLRQSVLLESIYVALYVTNTSENNPISNVNNAQLYVRHGSWLLMPHNVTPGGKTGFWQLGINPRMPLITRYSTRCRSVYRLGLSCPVEWLKPRCVSGVHVTAVRLFLHSVVSPYVQFFVVASHALAIIAITSTIINYDFWIADEGCNGFEPVARRRCSVYCTVSAEGGKWKRAGNGIDNAHASPSRVDFFHFYSSFIY